MAEINQSKTNSTNLFETYMYGKVSDRIDFYKYYKNDENSIDDPIFTGFTFDIDTLHSPLFYTGSGDTYIEPNTIRDSYGEGGTELAEMIESRLENVYKLGVTGSPNSYEINTLRTKDIIDKMEHYRAGYGTQEYVYLDNVQYGATDYIYMVDKVSIGKYGDNVGLSDVGNGTPSSSTYETYKNIVESPGETDTSAAEQKENNTDTTISPQDVETSVNEISVPAEENKEEEGKYEYPVDKQIDKLKESIGNENESSEQSALYLEHLQKKAEAEALLGECGNLKAAIDPEYKMSYDDMVLEIKKLKSSIDKDKDDVKKILMTYQDDAKRNLTRLRGNIADDTAMKGIEDVKVAFDAFYEGIVEKLTYTHLDIKIQKATNYDAEMATLNDNEKQAGVLEYLKDAWEVIKTQITGVTRSDASQKLIDGMSAKVKEIEKKLYGSDSNGNPYTQNNPSKDSMYGKYLEAKGVSENDEYSQSKLQLDMLEEARENYYDALEYEAYASTKQSEPEVLLPTVDVAQLDGESSSAYEERIRASKNIRGTYEVPQTVYDMLGFIAGMEKLTRKYPYVMQTVTGLDEAYKNYFVVKDPYLGSGDNKITISCFESLDLRVSSMFNKYFNAVYDRQYRRERVPINLRRFCCSIFVHDIRNFRHSLATLFPEGVNGDDVLSKITEVALNCVSAIEFKFYDCEIVPEDTGNIFDNVSNESAGDMRRTNFTFTYGNCVINFLPYADLKKYFTPNSGSTKPYDTKTTYTVPDMGEVSDNNIRTSDKVYSAEQVEENLSNVRDIRAKYRDAFSQTDSGDFRRWFDKSELGNINNNDYRDYIRHDAAVVVDDYYKTTIVNNFALNSISDKSRELTRMNDALRNIVVGISASTGIPVKGVTDALNIKFIDPIINERDYQNGAIAKNLGNVYNSRIIDGHRTEFSGRLDGFNDNNFRPNSTELGNVYNDKELNSHISGQIGKIDGFGENNMGPNAKDLGNTYNYEEGESHLAEGIGRIDGFGENNMGPNAKDLGNTYNYEERESHLSEGIGRIDGFGKEKIGPDVKDLGKIN